MIKCRKDCICLKCKLIKTELCGYGDCPWCKGKDGVFECNYLQQRSSSKCVKTEIKKSLNKYEILTDDLKEAKEKAIKLSEGVDDGGTANLDSTFLILKNWNEQKVLEAIAAAGLFCSGKRTWIGSGYFISINLGQGNIRTVARNEFIKILDEKGYKTLAFDKMD
ncbi:hypothetical protein [Clostridium sp. C2-6-12]|uniref:hypothetical protein n=1 Tax=Clostridium sp. C2-6-12 TaxID=2698832 RepID=UPI001FAB9F31|nr:hypothetical protein [Clostridium sp. C2-6-12]